MALPRTDPCIPIISNDDIGFLQLANIVGIDTPLFAFRRIHM